ncbi:hypothetical protein EMCRGX_G005290 [Ephydatia muelleri]
MAQSSQEESEQWTRFYPEVGLLDCPRCYSSFWRSKQRERHMRDTHHLKSYRWLCSTCNHSFPTKQHVANHFKSAHPGDALMADEEEGTEEENEELPSHEVNATGVANPVHAEVANATAFRCDYCERSLPSKRGLRNHERAHHQAEVSARLASEEATSQSKSKSNRWSEEEIARFAEAAERWGINSNIQLAREVGTRTAKQCGNFKKRFLQAHPEMVLLGDALPTGSQLSPTSGSSADSDSPPPSVEAAARLSRSPTHSPVSPSLGELILEAHAPPPKRMIEVWRKEPESPAHLRESSGHSVATAETPSPREVETPPPREIEATPTEKSGGVSQPISKSNNPLATESLEAEEWIQYPTTQIRGGEGGLQEELLKTAGGEPQEELPEAEGGRSQETPPQESPPSQPEKTPIPPVPRVRDILEVISSLLAEDDTQTQIGRIDPTADSHSGETISQEAPVSPAQQCSENEPLMGWPYSPGRTQQVFTPPTVVRRGGRAGHTGELDTTPTNSQHTNRAGPDYALRDYMQGYRVSMSQGLIVHSHLTPQGQDSGLIVHSHLTPQGQDSGLIVHSHLTPQGLDSGLTVHSHLTPQGQDSPPHHRPNQWGEGQEGGPRVGPNEPGKGKDTNLHPTGTTSTPPTGAAARPTPPFTATPTLTSQSGTATTTTRQREGISTPAIPAAVPPGTTRPTETPTQPAGATTPIPVARATPVCMNKADNQAPHKLFETIKPLSERILSQSEWAQWCQKIDAWTAGLSKWSYEREKPDTTQQAWSGRQGRKRKSQENHEGGQAGANQRGGGTQPERNRKINRMANLQRLYNRSPRECMDKGVDPLQVPITLQELKAVYQGVDGNTSPGPDHIGYNTWKKLGAEHKIVLSILNTCRVNGKIPPEWKISTTILIHKGDDPLALDNWRPIALLNTLYKIYAALIAKRITAWAVDEKIMSPAQKGFLPMEGCLEHNHLMSSVLQDSRSRKRPIVLTWLDLKDAYGSVPHHTLFTIMELAGIKGLTMAIVKDIYHQSSTSVRTGRTRTDPITIKRGVKQGCPLSPILFNLVMEVLIRAAESVTGAGYKVATSAVKSLAYADDLCTFASTTEVMQRMLDRVHQASEWAGLTFSPRKCATLSITRSQRSRQRVAQQEYHLGPTAIPVMTWEDRYKYLGVKTGADHAPDLEKLGTEYTSDVEVIMRSELTDWQKRDAIHRFAKPRLVYSLQNQLPTIGWARAIDKKVKASVKHHMKLPRRTMDAFLFAPWRMGGLGLPRIEDEVHIYNISSAYRLLSLSNDPLVTRVAQATLDATAKKRSKGTSTGQDFINSPPFQGKAAKGTFSPGGVRAMRAVMQQHHLARWSEAKDQGRAVTCISAHESSNHWIRGGMYTSFSEYRFALKARLNLLPTRTVRKRGGEAIQDTSCQRCYQKQETLAHILNHCPPNVGLIRSRHNRILHRLANAIPRSKGAKLLEQSIPGDGMALKPDLVILNKDKSEAYIVDVAVPFEGEDSFRTARQCKEDKFIFLHLDLGQGEGSDSDDLAISGGGRSPPVGDPLDEEIERRRSGMDRDLHPAGTDDEAENERPGGAPAGDPTTRDGGALQDAASTPRDGGALPNDAATPPQPSEPGGALPDSTEAATTPAEAGSTARRVPGQRTVDYTITHPNQTRFTCPDCRLVYTTSQEGQGQQEGPGE